MRRGLNLWFDGARIEKLVYTLVAVLWRRKADVDNLRLENSILAEVWPSHITLGSVLLE